MDYKTPLKKLETSRIYQEKRRVLNNYYKSLPPLELVHLIKEKYGE